MHGDTWFKEPTVVILAAALALVCGACVPQQGPKPTPTPTGTVTDFEGNVYPTLKIGQQDWMLENLKATKYNDGAPIPNVTDMTAWANLSSDAFSWFDNDVTNKDVYGALYNWYAVNTKKLCPMGWSIPSSDDWGALVNGEGGKGVSGGRMKETGTALWQAPNAGATNESGFSARPAGSRSLEGKFADKGQFALWWCSDQKVLSLPAASWFWMASAANAASVGGQSEWPTGYSVRCVRAAN